MVHIRTTGADASAPLAKEQRKLDEVCPLARAFGSFAPKQDGHESSWSFPGDFTGSPLGE